MNKDKALAFLVGVAILMVAQVALLHWSWNAFMPEMFHFAPLTWGKTIVLQVLSGCLFAQRTLKYSDVVK
jgi:hypothetical protein